jgi:hypothetical protein
MTDDETNDCGGGLSSNYDTGGATADVLTQLAPVTPPMKGKKSKGICPKCLMFWSVVLVAAIAALVFFKRK